MIQFACQVCGKTVAVQDNWAGKTGKCPQCKELLKVPKLDEDEVEDGELVEEPEANDVTVQQPKQAAAILPPPLLDQRLDAKVTECPYCGEDVLSHAKKCKHCGEFLNKRLRRRAAPNKWSPGVAAVLSFFMPGLGQMYKGEIGSGLLWVIGAMCAYILFFVVISLKDSDSLSLLFLLAIVILTLSGVVDAAKGDPKK